MGRLWGVLSATAFLGIAGMLTAPSTSADTADPDGPLADPVALLDRVSQNASRLESLTMTTYHLKSALSGKQTGRKVFNIQFNANRADIGFGAEHWTIDVNAQACTIKRGQKTIIVPIGEITAGQQPSLAAFVPLSPSLFFIRDIYSGYSFRISGMSSLDGKRVAILDGVLPGAERAGRSQLVIDIDRGLLLVERFFASSGDLVRETSYKDYRNYGVSYLPLRVEERHISRRREEVLITVGENAQVRGNGSHADEGSAAR